MKSSEHVLKAHLQRLTRRGLLRSGSAWAVLGLLGVRGPGPVAAAAPQSAPARAARSRVVLVRHRDVIGSDGSPDPKLLRRMLNEAVTALTGTADAAAAWTRVVRPGDVVGIKSNAWRMLATPPALEEALRAEMVAAGVKADDIAVDDQGVRQNPVFARATALVNVRPMRTHHWSGLGTCLKNYIMFVPRPADYHDDACATLGAIWKLPQVEGKTRLNVLVMLTPQFHGLGPHSFSPQMTWRYGGLIVGTDPVAVDATGARIIEAKRREFFKGERPLSPRAHHIQVADTRYGVGHSESAKIDLVRLGWTEEALI